MGKRGLTQQEKRDRLVKFLVETQEVYNYKEIEKYCVQQGFPQPTVKEILDMVIADDLVVQEKIGAGNYYWSFPSQAFQSLSNKIEKLKKETADAEAETETVESTIEEKMKGKEDTKERKQVSETLENLKKQVAAKEAELAKYRRNDPKRLEEISRLAG